MKRIHWISLMLVVLVFAGINLSPLVARWLLIRQLDFTIEGIYDSDGRPLQESGVRFLAEEVTGRLFDLFDVPHRDPGAGQNWIIAIVVHNKGSDPLDISEAEYRLSDGERVLGQGRMVRSKTLEPDAHTEVFLPFRTAVSNRDFRETVENGAVPVVKGRARLRKAGRIIDVPFQMKAPMPR